MAVNVSELSVEGSGPRLLVLIHGWPDTQRLWDPQVAAFAAAGYRCLRFTLPGFAPDAAEGGRGPHSLDEVVTAILRAIDAHRDGRKATLLLHDWGCLFGYQVALRHPDRVARVIGVDIGDAGSRRHLATLDAKQKAMIAGYQWWLAAAWRIGGAVGDRMSRKMAAMARCPTPAASIHAAQAWPYWVQWTRARGGFGGARLFTPTLPFLFISGARKPFMFHSPRWADEVAQRPGGRVLALPTGHWVMVQAPQVFNDAVLQWLADTNEQTEGH